MSRENVETYFAITDIPPTLCDARGFQRSPNFFRVLRLSAVTIFRELSLKGVECELCTERFPEVPAGNCFDYVGA